MRGQFLSCLGVWNCVSGRSMAGCAVAGDGSRFGVVAMGWTVSAAIGAMGGCAG